MLRALLPLALIATPATAAERSVAITDFDRVRVDGPFDVRLATRGNPAARVEADADVLASIQLRAEGGTLVVRFGSSSAAGRPRPRTGALPVITLTTPAVRSVAVAGGGRLAIDGPVAAPRLDLSVTGAGAIAAPAIDAEQLTVTLIGTGDISLGGAARAVRLTANGGGRIAAAGLVADDLVVHSEGLTDIKASARYTALASSTGVGPITILGQPDCKVRAAVGGAITCYHAAPY